MHSNYLHFETKQIIQKISTMVLHGVSKINWFGKNIKKTKQFEKSFFGRNFCNYEHNPQIKKRTTIFF